MSYFVHESSYIDDSVTIGEGTKIWHFCHIQPKSRIGKNCSFGQNVNVAENVKIGAKYPKGKAGYKRTLVKTGASIGANATIVCGHTIGKWAMIAAGAVVTTDVPDYALFAGVPARQIGWVCECGQTLTEHFMCQKCGIQYGLEEDNGKEKY